MSNTNIEELSREDLLRMLQRDRFVKEQLSARLANLLHENLELMGLIQEQQQDIRDLRTASNGDAEHQHPHPHEHQHVTS